MAHKQPISNSGGQFLLETDTESTTLELSDFPSIRKKYSCEYCSKPFSRSSHLSMHRRTHTGERPFVCQYCSRAFTQSSALYRHHKTCAKSPNKEKPEPFSKTTSVHQVSSTASKQKEMDSPISGHSFSAPTVYGGFSDKDNASDNDDDDIDDDIMFVCCDHTFTSSADYDKHVRSQHSKSQPDSFIPHCSTERDTVLSTASNKLLLNSHIVNKSDFNLYPTYGPASEHINDIGSIHNTQDNGQEPGIIYLFNTSSGPDTVTINLSDHSVSNSCSSNSRNASFLDNRSNSGIKLVASKPTVPSSDFINNYDYSEKQQINKFVSSMKPDLKPASRFSQPVLGVPHKSHSEANHINNLSNGLRKTPTFASIKTEASNPLKTSMESVVNRKEVKSSCIPTFSSHGRIKTSRLQSCQFCPRQFTRTSHLTQHLRTHTGERPFQCEYCGNAFTQSSALNRHLKTCHVAQSINSNVAGNATFQPQPLTSLPISSDFEASHEICYPYQDCEVVFPQPVPVDSYKNYMHADGINPEITIQTSSSPPMHMPLSYESDSSDSNSTSKVHFSAYSKSHIPKSCLAKMRERSIENQVLQSKRKPLFQKIVKSNKKFCCDVCSIECLSRQHLMLHMRKHLQPNSTSLKTTAQSQSRNHLPSSLVWAPSSHNKNLFRNKVYNTFNHKRTFEKHKSMSFASNAHPSSTLARPKTNSFFKKHPRFVRSSEESKLKDLSKKNKALSKSLQARNLKNHSEEFIVTLNSSEESTKDSVLSDRSESPKNPLYPSDSSFQRASKISTTVYTCDICMKSFYSDLLFRIHRSTHSLEKKKKKNSLTPSAKNRDHAGFNPTPTLETAPSTSSDQMRKTFPCVYCHKTFLRHSHLETHVRTHTGEKPFQCESCGRAFSQSSARNRHIKKCFMAKQILNTGLLTAESLTSTNLSQSTTTVINSFRNLDDSLSDVKLLNYDQPCSTSNAVQAHNPNESPSKYPMPSKETCVRVTPLGLHLKLPNSEEVKSYESCDSYSHQTTNQSSVNPIKDRKVIGNELKISKPEQECRNEGSGSTECLQIICRSEQQNPNFVEKNDDETNDLETIIFDSALQVVHDSLQMKSEYSLSNDCLSTKKESATSQAMLGSPEGVSGQNCPDPSDICPSPLDIPQPNVTLSLGSEFIDLMDTDLPNISHTMSTRQEEETSSSMQKDVYPDYSPETPPPFVSEYLSPKDAETDKPLAEVIEVSSSSSSFSVGGVIQRNINSGGIDKSYPCNYCGEIFSNSDLLNNHEKSHTAMKFFCSSCSDGFTDASALGKHLQICVAAQKESSKEPVSVTDICLSQGLQMPKIDENINEKRESAKAAEVDECQSSSSSSSLFNARQTNVDEGNNLEKKTLKNWPLKLFSDEAIVKSSELKDSFSDSGNAKSTFDHSSGKTYNIKSSEDSIEARSSDDQGAVGMETDCPTSARKLTCPYCDLDFSSPNQLDEHVSCHVSEKPFICWFCKESYVLSSDFEQHMKICGAPATFPNLSSPNSSKGESNNEDDDNNSKFNDVALFTPITVTANLSDCDDNNGDDERGGGGGVGNETDVPLAWDHSKDKINSSKLFSYQIQDPGTGSQSKNLQENGHNFTETFKSVEIFSNQLQINNPNQLVSIPDTSREFSPGSGSSAKDSMVENLTYPGENIKQSPKNNTNLNESSKKEVQDTNDKCSLADSTPEEITKELQVYEYPKNLSSEFLESQEALKDEPSESIVFLCCHQTYTSVQDYNEHLLNSHAEHTDNKSEEPREKQIPKPSKISKAEVLNGYRDHSSFDKRLLINNDPLTLNRYVCQFCTRGFSRSGYLIQHMRTHTGERPYPCQFCSKAFTQSSALKRHWKTCPKAKLFYNDGVKRTSAGYCVTLPGFQKSSEGNGKSGSRNISPLPVQLFENQTCNKSFSAGNNLLNSSPFGNIDEISCNKTNDGITKCEHCGLKFLKLDDFIQHSNTCSSADKISLMDGTFHQEFQSLGTRDQDKRSNQIPNNCLQQITIKESKNEDAQFSNIEIKKEALDVVFECDFCHKLFSDELEMVRHQESECLQNEPLNWNLAENLESRETTNAIKPEEIFPFTCCEEMFFDLKSYHIHRETHHSLKEHQNYNALCQGDDQTKQRLNSNVKIEVDLQNQIHYDYYLNSKSYSDSSPEIGQLSSVPKSKLDNTVGKRASDEHSELPSVDRSTSLDNISRFQVLESSNSVSESQALISAIDKKNYGIDSDGVISPSHETQKSSSAKDITQGHDTTLNWLQWENYISQQLNISNPNRTAVVASQEKKYACDYCDKKFTRSGHLVMHRRTHTGERPFSCSHCHKAFTQSSALNRHLKTCNLARLASTTHLETKSPTSELICCGINFHWAGALNVHLVTHNIYKCHICNQDFENFDLLLIHIKSHASQEQTPVSNSQGQSIDNHCDFCPVSFQSVVEQLIHMKTEHWTKSYEKLTSNNQVSSNPDNIPKLSCLSSKTEYSKPDNSSENSNGSSTKNSLESSSSFILNQPKPNFLSRTKIGKISRVRCLAQSTSLRIPSKQSIYSKYQQNKQYPSSTSLKRRLSTFLSEPKSVRSLEFSTPNTSMRSTLNHNLHRAIKRAVNNSSKPHTLPEQYTSLFGTLSPTKAKDQQSAIFDSTDIPLSQTDSSNNVLARILLNNHSNHKLMVKREKNDSHVYPNKTQSANSEAECDKDDNCYDEGQFNNNSDGSSFEAISSVINTFHLDKSSSQTKQYLHSDVSCLPNLKIQPSNLIALKRSLLNSGNLKSTTDVNVTAGKAEQLLLKTIKYQKEPNLFVSIDSSSSSSDFVCPLCQKSFTCSSHLNSHIQTHTEEWPYVCIHCNRCFQRENDLERHLKNCAVGNSKTLVQPSCSVVSNSRINEFFTDASSTDKKITFVSAAVDEQNLDETIFESQQNHVDVTKNGAITPDVHNRALSASFSPGKSDNELSIAAKIQFGRFNLQNSQQPNKIGETISLSKVSPCTDTKDDDNKKEYKESVMAATEPNTNPSQVQEVQCQSNKSFLKTNGSKRNPPQTLCSPQQTLHSSGFDRYIVKIEPGSEDVKRYDALSEMSDLQNSFNVSTIGKLSDKSKEKLKNYSHNDKLLQPDDQSDPTLYDSRNKPKTKDPDSTLEFFDQSGVSLSQNGTRTLQDSACTTSVVPKKKKNSHVCRKCGQIFPQFFDLFQHNCPRSAERYSFTCEYCEKSFSRHSHLITHRRTHTGERPYQCCYCQRSFTQTSALNRHQKKCSFIPAHLKTKIIKTTLNGSSNSL